MTPYEIMLSESQERMLLVVKKGREAEVERIFEKWDLHAVHIGDVTTDGRMRVKDHGEVVADIPNSALTDDAPVYRAADGRAGVSEGRASTGPRVSLGAPASPAVILRRLLASPGIASKRWVYRQYDHMVRTNTLVLPGMGAGVIRVKGTSRALALSVDCNARFVYLDPYRRCAARRGRGVAQRGLCRWSADRGHQLSELRQSAAARDHVAVRPGRRRAWAPPVGRSIFRLPAATSVSTTRPTAAGSCRRRCSVSSV